MDLRRQIAVVRQWFLLIVAGVAIAAAASYIVSSGLPKTYEAQARLIVGQSLTSANPDYTQLLASQRLSQTYATVATTRPLFERVIEKLGLDLTSDELDRAIRADAPRDTTLITITVSDTDAERAADIANAVAAELIAASPAIQGRSGDVATFVEDDLRATQRQIEDAQTEADRLAALPSRTEQEEQQLQTLQTRLIALRSSYANLLAYASNSSSNLLTVVEPAIAAEFPSSPRVLLNTALAALVGLLLALGIAFLAEYLDDTVKSADDVQELLELPTLGAITQIRTDKGRSEIYRMITILYPRSPITEAFRTLRTNVEFASVDTPLKTLLVTSALQGEGKTTTAANLAVVFAQAGKRVLLVDADLRKPGVHRILDLPNETGLSTLLLRDASEAIRVIQPTEVPGLRVLTTGPLPPNPAELIGSQRFRNLLAHLEASFDLLILDSPPIHAVTDSAILSSIVNGTLFVVYAGKTRRGALRAGREALAKADANVLGVSLNRLSKRGRAEGYYEYYQQYGYGYGHGAKDKQPAAGK